MTTIILVPSHWIIKVLGSFIQAIVNEENNCALFFTGFSCNFDKEMCGFSQSRNDKFDWSRRSGSTPSSSTGPASDHSGSGELETMAFIFSVFEDAEMNERGAHIMQGYLLGLGLGGGGD